MSPRYDLKIIKEHPSYRQVLLDVERCNKWAKSESFGNLSKIQNDENDTDDESDNLSKQENSHDISGNVLDEKLLDKLISLIISILIEHPQLQYYQGFHDVCLTLLLLSEQDEHKAFDKVNKLTKTHFSVFMQPTMFETQEYLDMILIVIGYLDAELEQRMNAAEVGSIFALSWVITWFSHEIKDREDLDKLFKYFEKRDTHMIIYFCACMVVTNADEIKRLPLDMASMHQFLCRIPKQENLPLEKWIKVADEIFTNKPPIELKKELQRRRMMLKLKDTFGIVQKSAVKVVKSPSIKAIIVVGCAYLISIGLSTFRNQWMIDH